MKQVIIIFSLLFLTISSYSQNIKREMKVGDFTLQVRTVDPLLDTSFFDLGEMPAFPGGVDSLFSFAMSSLYYPKSAINDSVQGRVIIRFSVDTTGQVYNEYVLKSLRLDIDTVCLSMLKKMPHWEAGSLDGKLVRVELTWPIKFSLAK